MQPINETPFDTWNALKDNTRIRTAMWLEAGRPAAYAPIDNLQTMTESAARFRTMASSLAAGAAESLRRQIRLALAAEGIKDLRPRQVPDSKWARKLKGARPIAWVPGAVPKDENA